jgi:hypothetical protein
MTNVGPCVTQTLGPVLAAASRLLYLYRTFVCVPLNKSDVSSAPVIPKPWSAEPVGGRKD